MSTVSTTVTQHDSKISAHTSELANIAYEQGVVAAQDSHAWYTQNDGLTITMQACYNLIGDYCILNVRDCMLCQGWVDLYYSLPVQVLNNASIIVSNTSNFSQLIYVETTILEGNHVLHLKRVDGQG